MSGKITISTKVGKELWEKIQSYNIDASKIISDSLEQAIRDREIQDLMSSDDLQVESPAKPVWKERRVGD
jgi:hypothetical protein